MSEIDFATEHDEWPWQWDFESGDRTLPEVETYEEQHIPGDA